MKLLFTPTARSLFLRALAYIRRDKPAAAVSFRQKAEQTLTRLQDHPASGRIIPEFPEGSYREVIVAPYRFFYRVQNEIIWIVAVWHGAQLPMEPLEDETIFPLKPKS